MSFYFGEAPLPLLSNDVNDVMMWFTVQINMVSSLVSVAVECLLCDNILNSDSQIINLIFCCVLNTSVQF